MEDKLAISDKKIKHKQNYFKTNDYVASKMI